MRRIRIDNDFVLTWEIYRDGEPENLEAATSIRVKARVFGKSKDVPFTVQGSIVRMEFTPEILDTIGTYNLLLTYSLPDPTLEDGDRKVAVDIDAFQIVGKTGQADEADDIAITSDMAVGFQGKSAYQLWLETHDGTEEDFFDWIREPATEAAQSVSQLEDTVSDNEDIRQQQEADRQANTGIAIGKVDALIENMVQAEEFSENDYNEI